jgi:DNA-binding IclR family transcriptional regulator
MHNPTFRVVKILNIVSENNGEYSMSEIARRCDIPIGTIPPILKTLSDLKYLSFDPEKKTYAIGIRCFLAGLVFTRSSTAYGGITGIIKTMTDTTQETAHYCTLEHGDVLYVCKSESPQPIRMYSAVGRTLPAYGTAVGKALLSGLSDEEVMKLYPNGLQPLTKHTITDYSVLLTQLAEVRRTGFAEECEESNLGIRCIAKPIHDAKGHVISAISIVIPLFRFSQEKEKVVKEALTQGGKDLEAMVPFLAK